ncbi:MAG TPA: catechol 1,2-dioxygenase [Pedomonas sp.]|uniref:catechol 1,2-dioxygenase n=1 Tax=Pedomonas sp. TaxID=2976421 RepID=UPI002F3F6E38
MTVKLVKTQEVQILLDKLSGLDQQAGDARLKAIVRRIVGDLFATIEDFNISDDEVWQALNFAARGSAEFGLWAAGLGLERFLDIRADAADAAAGLTGGTPRTIEGPLYVAGAPESVGYARMDDGSEEGKVDTLILHGQVRDVNGAPIEGAKVEIWHANSLGNYSYFDTTQSEFNLRRTIFTDADGRYVTRTTLPVGYACPEGGSTETILKNIGRHGNRPAHVHYFVSAENKRHLTTQINIDGDPYLHDDFAYATRDELVPPVKRLTGGALAERCSVSGEHVEIQFDIMLHAASSKQEEHASARPRAAG